MEYVLFFCVLITHVHVCIIWGINVLDGNTMRATSFIFRTIVWKVLLWVRNRQKSVQSRNGSKVLAQYLIGLYGVVWTLTMHGFEIRWIWFPFLSGHLKLFLLKIFTYLCRREDILFERKFVKLQHNLKCRIQNTFITTIN